MLTTVTYQFDHKSRVTFRQLEADRYAITIHLPGGKTISAKEDAAFPSDEHAAALLAEAVAEAVRS